MVEKMSHMSLFNLFSSTCLYMSLNPDTNCEQACIFYLQKKGGSHFINDVKTSTSWVDGRLIVCLHLYFACSESENRGENPASPFYTFMELKGYFSSKLNAIDVMQEIMSATGADGGDLKFIKDEKLSRKANSPPCTSDHVITFFFQITWCVTSQLNTTKVIILFALFFQVLSLTFCFGSMWPILQENVSSLTRNQDLQILKDSRKSKTRRESGEKR